MSKRSFARSRKCQSVCCEPLETRQLLSGAVFQTSNAVTSSDNNGPVITSPHVALIFWGAAFGNNTANPSAATIQGAVNPILTGQYLGDLSSYRAGLGNGYIFNTYTIANSSPGANFVDANVRTMLTTNINNGTLPRPTVDANLLYMVVTQNGSSDPTESLGSGGAVSPAERASSGTSNSDSRR